MASLSQDLSSWANKARMVDRVASCEKSVDARQVDGGDTLTVTYAEVKALAEGRAHGAEDSVEVNGSTDSNNVFALPPPPVVAESRVIADLAGVLDAMMIANLEKQPQSLAAWAARCEPDLVQEQVRSKILSALLPCLLTLPIREIVEVVASTALDPVNLATLSDEQRYARAHSAGLDVALGHILRANPVAHRSEGP